MPVFSAQHYNILAKEIRGLFERPAHGDYAWVEYKISGRNGALTSLVLHLCERFVKDNPLFDPVRFTDAAIPIWFRIEMVEDATTVKGD